MAYKTDFWKNKSTGFDTDMPVFPTKFDKDILLFFEVNDVRKSLNNLMMPNDFENAKIHLKNLEIWLQNKTSAERKNQLTDIEKKYAMSKSKTKDRNELILIEKNYIFQKFSLLMQIIDDEITEEEIMSEE